MENGSDENHNVNTTLSKYACIYASQKAFYFYILYLIAFHPRLYNFAAQQPLQSSVRQSLHIKLQNFNTIITFSRKIINDFKTLIIFHNPFTRLLISYTVI